MAVIPAGPASRHTLLMRVRRAPYAKLAERRAQLIAELDRDMTFCDALEVVISESERFRQMEATQMTVKIDDNRMSSPDTIHLAIRVTLTAWAVTWLRIDHRLTRNQAITAMTIASVVGASDEVVDKKDPIWPHIRSWAGELGVSPEKAVQWASQPKKWEDPK